MTNETEALTTGLSLHIYRHIPYGDTSARGVSSRTHSVTLVGIVNTRLRAQPPRAVALTGGSRGPFTASEASPAVVLVIRSIRDRVIYHVEPYHADGYRFGRYMSGGTFVTGDSRFSDLVGFYGAVSFHDRDESQLNH